MFCSNADKLTEDGDFNGFISGIQRTTKKAVISKGFLEGGEPNDAVVLDAENKITNLDAPVTTDDCDAFLDSVSQDISLATQSLRHAQELCETEPQFVAPLSDSTSNGVEMVQYFIGRLINSENVDAFIFEEVVKMLGGVLN